MNRLRQEIFSAACSEVRIDEDSCSQVFCFDKTFCGFDGHFPGLPILPAIVQMLLGQLVAEQFWSCPLTFVAVERARFIRPLGPDEQIEVRLSCEQAQSLSCKVELWAREEKASGFSLSLSKEDTL